MDQTTKHPRGYMGELADSLMSVYDAYQESMRTRMSAADRLRTAELDLEGAQDAILLSPDGPVDGKNEAIRGAQLRALTERQYLEYVTAKGRYQQATMETEDPARIAPDDASDLESPVGNEPRVGGVMGALGQHAKAHTIWQGIDSEYWLTCPKSGVTPLLEFGRYTQFCPACGFRLVPLEKVITNDVPEYEIQDKEY